MCRFVFYQGPSIKVSSLVTEPSHSLIRQSSGSRERSEPLNGDGFGLAWYPLEPEYPPALFRSVSPAWNNTNLFELARVIKSTCILAHVRAATQVRAVSEANCHPFTHGNLTMMHNGDLGGFAALRRKLLERLSNDAFDLIDGSTDSEHLFALFVDALGADAATASVSAMTQAMRECIATALELSRESGPNNLSYLNIAATNGRSAVVTRFTDDTSYDGESLYLHRGLRYICIDGVCRMVDPDENGAAVIVSSEPLSDDPGWQVVPPNHIVKISADRQVELEPLAL